MNSRTTATTNLTFSQHLDELRRRIVRIVAVVVVLAVCVFYFKQQVFDFLLAPCSPDFVSFRMLRDMLSALGLDADIFSGNLPLIATDISSQFMAHLSVSVYLSILLASPFILHQILGFVLPALYDNEKRYAITLLRSVYLLFFAGLAVAYLILFPISCRFLAGYSVSSSVTSLITLDSYLSLFISLSLLMGLVFQLPIVSLTLARMGLIDAEFMSKYRRHALIAIMVVAAIITPPDILTLLIVTLPLYCLYELSILCVRMRGLKKQHTTSA